MPKPSDRKTLNVPDEVHRRLSRLARLHNKSIGWLVDRFSSVFESRWRERMSEDEFARYLRDDISHREARKIMEREANEIEPLLDTGDFNYTVPANLADH